jgi:drug/metabolite transporter (DMT)-like permease
MLNNMGWKKGLHQPGVLAALGAALLFGAGTPFAKILLDTVDPWLLAGLLYLGSGVGLILYRQLKHAPNVCLLKNEIPWFAGAILSGGIIGPVLLMIGLTSMPASGASLLLNSESVFTALIAWFVFKENYDRRIALGMVAIVLGAVVLSTSGGFSTVELWPSLAILGACLAWGIDNNLTRRVSLIDATWIASVKGCVSGLVNLILAFSLGASTPEFSSVVSAMFVGLFAYGLSLTLFVIGLRHLGTARTGAYFSVAPFFGALLALLMGESITIPLLIAGTLMALGTWLHLTESHEHEHFHEELEHNHEHIHDIHHQHSHDLTVTPETKHSHQHRHKRLFHKHPHFPDSHHRHRH